MVLQVLAYSRRIMQHVNTQGRQVTGWPNAGQHKKLGRNDGARAEDGLPGKHREHLATAFNLDADRPVAIEDDPVSAAVGPDGKVQAVA